jgi:hypothetical protein
VKQDLLPLREAREQFERAYLQQEVARVNFEAGPRVGWAALEVVHAPIKDRDRCYVVGSETIG